MIFSRRDQSFKTEFWKFTINSEQKSHHPHPVNFGSVTDIFFTQNALFIYICKMLPFRAFFELNRRATILEGFTIHLGGPKGGEM